LICEQVCLPAKAEVTLPIPVERSEPELDDTYAQLFSDTRFKLPLESSEWGLAATTQGKTIQMSLQPPTWYQDHLGELEFFPDLPSDLDYAAPQSAQLIDGSYYLDLQRVSASEPGLPRLVGVLVSERGWRGEATERSLLVNLPVGTGSIVSLTAAGILKGATPFSVKQFVIALLFAGIGGLILNLMPCVLPVLSLKILGIIKQSQDSRLKRLRHGWLYSIGVVSSFWLLAGLLILFRTGGEELGWGFQLQSPVVVVLLANLFFLFALNLFGLFEVGTSLTGITSHVPAEGASYLGSFISGVFATLVATPCTAPFMGSAVGYALTRSSMEAFAVFSALGIGLAMPYLVLCASPALLRFVPRPGRWMESLKQLFGFFLVGTTAWLCWVLGQQLGADAISGALVMLLMTGVAGWLLGRWGRAADPRKQRWIVRALALLILLLAMLFTARTISQIPANESKKRHAEATAGGLDWLPFSPRLIEELRRAGKPILVDFTAAWCLSCNVNKRIALETDRVERRLKELGVVVVRADWTNRDPTITRALAGFGRSGVPLYLLYGKGSKPPKILPAILTPGIVLNALDELDRCGLEVTC